MPNGSSPSASICFGLTRTFIQTFNASEGGRFRLFLPHAAIRHNPLPPPACGSTLYKRSPIFSILPLSHLQSRA